MHACMYVCIHIDQAIQRNEMNPYSPEHVRKFTAHLGPCLEKVDYLCMQIVPAPCAPLNISTGGKAHGLPTAREHKTD